MVLSATLVQAQSYDDLFRQAAELSAKRDYLGAIARYKAALQLRPGAPEAISNLGVMYHVSGDYATAVATMSDAVRTAPDVFPAQLILGMDLVRLNRAKEAVPHLETAVRLSPGNREARLALAAAYVAVTRLADAVEVYEKQLTSTPNDPESLYGLGICYERMAEAASRALSRLPGGAALDKRFLGEYLVERGEMRLAEEALRDATALEKSEPSPEASEMYARACQLANKSRDVFTRLVTAAPHAWQSKLFIADVQRQQRKFPDGIANYEAVQHLQPDNPAPVLGLATAYWELGQFERAEPYLQRVLAMNPASAQALFELANIRVRQHREREAVPLLRKYLAVDPDSLSACADLGRAYFHLGRYEHAAEYLERARPIDRTGDIHYQLATVLKRLGHTADADAAFRQSSVLRTRELERERRLRVRDAPNVREK